MGLCIANDLSPAILTGETRTIGFDFGPILNTGVTIASIQSVSCAVHSGTDLSTGARLLGSAAIVSSDATGASGGGVAQNIGAMIAGVTYTLICYVTTSDGQVLGLLTHISCVAPS